MEVHRQLGCGFLEPVYQEALELELAARKIPFVRELKLSLEYKGRLLDAKYSPDFICFDSVVVELKALSRTGGCEEAQVINYLKVTGHEVGATNKFRHPQSRTSSLRPNEICVICGLLVSLE
jgi:GxxExxY protein